MTEPKPVSPRDGLGRKISSVTVLENSKCHFSNVHMNACLYNSIIKATGRGGRERLQNYRPVHIFLREKSREKKKKKTIIFRTVIKYDICAVRKRFYGDRRYNNNNSRNVRPPITQKTHVYNIIIIYGILFAGNHLRPCRCSVHIYK